MRALISGGAGLLAKELVRTSANHEVYPIDRNDMNIRNIYKIKKQVDRIKPDIFIHCAAMTTPMSHHEENPSLSIETNIIGTSNVAIVCGESNLKLVYISTDYVYIGLFSNNKETDPVLPVNQYAWSKLGGECSVRAFPNNLILRCAFTQRPFKHESAFNDSYKSYMYVDEIASVIWKLIDRGATGIVNVGGKSQSVYEFAKRSRLDVKPISRAAVSGTPLDTTMDLYKMKGFLND